MDNIIIKKTWCDEELMELEIIANNEFVTVSQECYVGAHNLIKNAESIQYYLEHSKNECYVEYGRKTGNYTPAFSMKFLPMDDYGHIKIEMDMEIADNNARTHRCLFFVNTEMGVVEQFANNMRLLPISEIESFISL